jgi:radical SAM protein with 4Fe4S-binding SPASM domain
MEHEGHETCTPELEIQLEPVRPAGVVGGHLSCFAGDDVLFSNDALLEPLQPYPGALLPRLPGKVRYPVPDRVGEYCSWSEFVGRPKYMAQWVHWPKRCEMVLDGRYHEIPAAHFEGIFTLVCNFMCPHCSRRVTRSRWVEGGTWDHNTPIEKKNTMHAEGLKRVIDELAAFAIDGQMGIVWGGGDPTANPFTYDGMDYAHTKGLTSSFLTNGVFLDVDRCLDADPILIRVSLNCGTEEAYRRFHGYPPSWDYFQRALQNLRMLARRKLERRARTLVGVSLIVDERNLDDLMAAVGEIRAVVDDVGPGIDYVIARPVMNYGHFDGTWAKLEADTAERAKAFLSPGGEAAHVLEELRIPLVLIKDSFEPPPDETFYGDDTRCLAYSMYGEIRHNGDVQLCSDSYGDPDYTIGNIFDSSLPEIWRSERRRAVLARIDERACWKTRCPHNSRGHHHNRVFHQIEQLRRGGRMDLVRSWVEDLRACTLPLRHSFFV